MVGIQGQDESHQRPERGCTRMGFLRAVRTDRDCTRCRWVHDDIHKARIVKDGYQDHVTSNAETRMPRRTELVLLRTLLRPIFETFNTLKPLTRTLREKSFFPDIYRAIMSNLGRKFSPFSLVLTSHEIVIPDFSQPCVCSRERKVGLRSYDFISHPNNRREILNCLTNFSPWTPYQEF